jgi:hypothetical protein
MVITTSDSRTATSVRIFGRSAEMSIPTSASASTAAGFTASAGADPAERTSTVPWDRWVRNAAAIWDRPALCTHTNNTLGFDTIARFSSVVVAASRGALDLSRRDCTTCRPGIPAILTRHGVVWRSSRH